MHDTRRYLPAWLNRVIATILTLLLATFFGFVGGMKAFAPFDELAKHHAWTVYLPEWLGRAIGWSEMACAVLLVAGLVRPPFAKLAAAILLLNQLGAAIIHYAKGETASLPQNGLIIAACLAIILLQWRGRATVTKGECG